MHFLMALLQLVNASTLVEYKFYKNFGKVFYDYSGNSYHSVNGDSLSTSTNEMICTDRGIYSDGNSGQVTLPPNSVKNQAFVFPSTFTIVFWRRWIESETKSEYNVLYITSDSDSDKHILINRETDSNKICCDFKISCLKFSKCKEEKLTCKIYLASWSLISIEIVLLKVKIYVGTSKVFDFEMNCPIESSNIKGNYGFLSYSGTKRKNLFGFIWNFIVLDQGGVYTSYISSSGLVSTTCLIGSGCSCTDKVNDAELGVGCLQHNKDPKLNSYLESCSECSGSCSKSICYDCTCSSNSCEENNSELSCLEIAVSCGLGYLPTKDVSGNCVACDPSCKTCEDTTHCLICISQYATPDSLGGCKCSSTAYGTAPLTSSTSCNLCLSSCKTCTNSTTCLSCISENAYPSTSGCECDSGYFLSRQDLSYTDSCSACHSHCLTCENSLNCLTCKDSYAEPKADGGCVCIKGYYAVQGSDILSCALCNTQCLQCSSLNVCTECVAENTEIDAIGSCGCKEGYYDKNGLDNSNGCVKCTDKCLNCTGQEYFQCTLCENWLIDGVCFDLPSIGYSCKDGVCTHNQGPYLEYDFLSVGTVFMIMLMELMENAVK